MVIIYKGDPDAAIAAVQDLMWKNAAILRSQDGLTSALRVIEEISNEYAAGDRIQDADHGGRAITAQHMLLLSRALLSAMLNRKESRGAHGRVDYPSRDDANYQIRFEVRCRDGNFTVCPEREWTI